MTETVTEAAMFAALPDQTGVKYMAAMLESAMRDEERARTALIRYASRLQEEAAKAADGRQYRQISADNPDPLEVFNQAVRKVDAQVEAFRAVAWAAMTDIDTASAQSQAFDAWVAAIRAKTRS